MNNFAINFDLYTDAESLDEFYNIFNIEENNLYFKIKEYMYQNGFHWIQGSGYFTDYPITNKKLDNIIYNLFEKNKELGRFCRDIKKTIVLEGSYSYHKIINKYKKVYNKLYEKELFEYNKKIKSADEIKEKYRLFCKNEEKEKEFLYDNLKRRKNGKREK